MRSRRHLIPLFPARAPARFPWLPLAPLQLEGPLHSSVLPRSFSCASPLHSPVLSRSFRCASPLHSPVLSWSFRCASHSSWTRQWGVDDPPCQQLKVHLHTLHFLLLGPETCVLLDRRSNHLSYSTWLLIKLASPQWYTTGGLNQTLIPLVDFLQLREKHQRSKNQPKENFFKRKKNNGKEKERNIC